MGDISKKDVDNILQSKADMLSKANIPPLSKIKPAPIPIKTVNNPNAPKPPEFPPADIPKFDLAEEIMAEQRKITTMKRKAPGQITELANEKPKDQANRIRPVKPAAAISEQDRMITEIVARDIEELCSGNRVANNEARSQKH